MKLESFSRWLFLYHQESGKQCPRIAIRLLALLVGDSPSPFEHRISFCGCAFLRNAFHLPAAVRKCEKTGASAVLLLFLFPVILAFLPISYQPVYVGFRDQQFPHFLAGLPVLGIVFFLSFQQCCVLGLQTLDGGQLLDTQIVKCLFCRLVEQNIRFMFR